VGPSFIAGPAGRKVVPSSWLRTALLVLTALSVIAWGTYYKTSLYKSLADQGKAPAAKLCTRASEAAKSQVDASVHEISATEPYHFTSSSGLLTEVVRHARPLRVEVPRPRTFLAVRNVPALFFRPPPSI
jgi:hypothetical protein